MEANNKKPIHLNLIQKIDTQDPVSNEKFQNPFQIYGLSRLK